MSDSSLIPLVLLDPSFDLHQGGFCNCRRCCAAFADRFKEALHAIDPDARVLVTTYDSQQEQSLLRDGGWTDADLEAGRKANLWQRAHEATEWHPLHIGHFDTQGHVDDVQVVFDGNVPEGWAELDLDDWSPSDMNEVGAG